MATTAQNKNDVDQMTTRERLWDSLSHSYGQQIDESNKAYDAAISQADRQMLGRGMQRSSYNSQVLGNLNNQKINVQNNIWSNLIADYENRSIAADQQDLENARYDQQYADSRADTIWNQNFQQAQADRSADQWERQFAQGNADTDRQLAASYVSAIVANGGVPSDDLLARAGLSRADAELMAKKAAYSNGPGKTSDDDGSNTPPTGDTSGGLFNEDILARLKGAWDNTFKSDDPTNPKRVTTAIDDAIVKAYKEANSNNFADLPIVDFSGKSATGWTTQNPTGPTQNTGVALNTEEIKKRKKESESLVNKPHINI